MKLEQLAEIAQKDCEIAPDAPLIVGVSGGPDSLCLLDGLFRLGFSVVAAHFDHALRPDSAQDAESMREAARRMGVPFVTDRQDAAAFARQERMTLEEAARALRYRFLFACARQIQAQAVAVGHTADDQVETVLMHLLRGAGLAGLAGMAYRVVLPDWDDRIPLARPLLPFWREETLAYCQERGLSPIFDPTNQDTAFFRNRLRHELIPYLETYNPQARKALWRTARILAGEAEVVRSALREALEGAVTTRQQDRLALDRGRFQSLEPGLRRGVLRAAAVELLAGETGTARVDLLFARDVDFEAVERALGWIDMPGSGRIDLVQGLRLAVEGERIWLFRAEALEPAGEWPQLLRDVSDLPVPGAVELGSGWRLSADWREGADIPSAFPADHSPWEAWLDADSLPGPLGLRRSQPGDRFQPLGMDGRSLKLSDFWINEKLPRRARQGYPLLVCGDALVWVPGFRPAHPFRIRERTRRALYMRLERVD